MSTSKNTATEQWVNIISQNELPAITSTAKLLDKFSNDDTSSLPKLSQSILHDQALSSCILKVANNIQHMSHSKVTTISRATVVLGIQSVKNICLTSILIENLFKNKNLSIKVYNRLIQLMASSFYAGLIAKMMVPGYNEDTQEQVYLAAMLYRIGETAFWSVGEKFSEQLIEYVDLPQSEFDKKSKEIIGTTFFDISKGLAQKWGLGNLLEKSLDHPECRTSEMKIIYLADKLSNYIAFPPDSIDEFNQVIDEISQLRGTTTRQLREKIKQTRESAIELLGSYGASILEDSIKPLPTIEDFENKEVKPTQKPQSKEEAQLSLLMKLTQLSKTSKDFNEFLQLTIQSLLDIIELDTCTFFMLTSDKSQLKARFSYDSNAQEVQATTAITLAKSTNIFSEVINSKSALLINNYTDAKWQNYITEEVEDLIDKGAICLASVKINNNVIGVIIGQRFSKPPDIKENNFNQFRFLVEHLNMCLSMISRQ